MRIFHQLMLKTPSTENFFPRNQPLFEKKILPLRSKSAKIEIDWSELSADEEDDIIRVIEKHYDYINECIDKVFNGEKVDILRITQKI